MYVLIYMCRCVCVCTSAPCTNSALCRGTICCSHTMSWYVGGMKGGWWVLRRRWRFRITQPQIDVALNPLALFWVLLYVRQRTVGCRETDIWNLNNSHACGYNGLINAFVMPGRVLLLTGWQMEKITLGNRSIFCRHSWKSEISFRKNCSVGVNFLCWC